MRCVHDKRREECSECLDRPNGEFGPVTLTDVDVTQLKPPADSKPREWWIRGSTAWPIGGTDAQYPAGWLKSGANHVISYDAYAQLERERDELREVNAIQAEEMCRQCDRADKYKAALEWIVNNSVTVEHCYSKAREALDPSNSKPAP